MNKQRSGHGGQNCSSLMATTEELVRTVRIKGAPLLTTAVVCCCRLQRMRTYNQRKFIIVARQ
jgi:hypothetical protein